jgi:hypothetical protein
MQIRFGDLFFDNSIKTSNGRDKSCLPVAIAVRAAFG